MLLTEDRAIGSTQCHLRLLVTQSWSFKSPEKSLDQGVFASLIGGTWRMFHRCAWKKKKVFCYFIDWNVLRHLLGSHRSCVVWFFYVFDDFLSSSFILNFGITF